MYPVRLNIVTGTRYGKLVAISEADPFILPSGQKNRAILCKCDCGNIKPARLVHLVRGRALSCGCTNERHGDTGSGLHNTWRGMIQRAKSAKHINSDRYFYRGIGVCNEWLRYPDFKRWAIGNGYQKGLVIDRKDNDKGYYPDNCRFVSQLVNSNNRSNTTMIVYGGVFKSLSEVIHEKHLLDNYAAIRGRLKRGWIPDEAINTPIREGKYRRGARR